MQWKGVVENQELHFATSLTRTPGGKVSRRCGSRFANFDGELDGVLLFYFSMHMSEHRGVWQRAKSQTLVHYPALNHRLEGAAGHHHFSSLEKTGRKRESIGKEVIAGIPWKSLLWLAISTWALSSLPSWL